jgi:hypothetical protein
MAASAAGSVMVEMPDNTMNLLRYSSNSSSPFHCSALTAGEPPSAITRSSTLIACCRPLTPCSLCKSASMNMSFVSLGLAFHSAFAARATAAARARMAARS